MPNLKLLFLLIATLIAPQSAFCQTVSIPESCRTGSLSICETEASRLIHASNINVSRRSKALAEQVYAELCENKLNEPAGKVLMLAATRHQNASATANALRRGVNKCALTLEVVRLTLDEIPKTVLINGFHAEVLVKGACDPQCGRKALALLDNVPANDFFQISTLARASYLGASPSDPRLAKNINRIAASMTTLKGAAKNFVGADLALMHLASGEVERAGAITTRLPDDRKNYVVRRVGLATQQMTSEQGTRIQKAFLESLPQFDARDEKLAGIAATDSTCNAECIQQNMRSVRGGASTRFKSAHVLLLLTKKDQLSPESQRLKNLELALGFVEGPKGTSREKAIIAGTAAWVGSDIQLCQQNCKNRILKSLAKHRTDHFSVAIQYALVAVNGSNKADTSAAISALEAALESGQIPAPQIEGARKTLSRLKGSVVQKPVSQPIQNSLVLRSSNETQTSLTSSRTTQSCNRNVYVVAATSGYQDALKSFTKTCRVKALQLLVRMEGGQLSVDGAYGPQTHRQTTYTFLTLGLPQPNGRSYDDRLLHLLSKHSAQNWSRAAALL